VNTGGVLLKIAESRYDRCFEWLFFEKNKIDYIERFLDYKCLPSIRREGGGDQDEIWPQKKNYYF